MKGAQEEVSVLFNWAYDAGDGDWVNPVRNASDNFGEESGSQWPLGGMSEQQWNAAAKLALTILKLRQALDRAGNTDEPINVVAHSQGTLVTIAAINLLRSKGYKKDDLRLGSMVFMGSPLDKEDAEYFLHDNYIKIEKAAGLLQGNMAWYWSKGDWTAGFKGGIGGWGLDTTKYSVAGISNVKAVEILGVPHSGEVGWLSGEWVPEHKVANLAIRKFERQSATDFGYLISKQGKKNPTFSDSLRKKLKDVNSLGQEWAGKWWGGVYRHNVYDIPSKPKAGTPREIE